MEFTMSVNEYKEQIKQLQKDMPDVELEWTSNSRWIDKEALPTFRATKIFKYNGIVIKAKVSINTEIIDDDRRQILINIYSQGDNSNGTNLTEGVHLGLESDKERLLGYVEGYIVN